MSKVVFSGLLSVLTLALENFEKVTVNFFWMQLFCLQFGASYLQLLSFFAYSCVWK